ncbi:MAG: N-acetylglucosamine-6-phosphate deacetylase [Anaerolineae bacterium]|nr:N-acetylglucosamine-6-phosphate deacetylase [Anaerolineae bacterium]
MPVITVFEPLTGRTRQVRHDSNRILSITDAVPAAAQTAIYAFPGFCDMQVNGAYGIDINAPHLTTEHVHRLCELLLAEGVTAWLPTVITASNEAILHQLAVVRRACESDPLCAACIPGIHLEGPFLSPQEGARGAHPAEYIRPPDWEQFQHFQAAAGGRIRLVTLAPEVEGGLDFITRLHTAGIIPAIGHSLADSATIHAAVNAGARFSTHLGNGLPALLPRHANPLLAQLVQDNLSAGVIFDGHHLPSDLRILLLRAKGMEHLVMVSDATRLAGMPPGIYEEAVGGTVELHPNGRLSLYGTPYLAGAAQTLKQNVERTLREDALPLPQVLRMASENPRRLLGLPEESLVLFTLDPGSGAVTIQLTALAGQMIPIEPQPGEQT